MMNIPTYIERFRKDLEFLRYRQNTIETYASRVEVFLNHFNHKKDHEHINEYDIKEFLYKFKEHNTQRSYHSAIKAFYKFTCRQPNKFKYIQYCKRNRKLPIVLSPEEMQRIIFACHTSATHLVEMGTDMSKIQRILGHQNIRTTHLYGHISNSIISKIKSPLQLIVNNGKLLPDDIKHQLAS